MKKGNVYGMNKTFAEPDQSGLVKDYTGMNVLGGLVAKLCFLSGTCRKKIWYGCGWGK